MAVAATTELECINIMLAAIGEAPINTLTGTLPVDAVTAQKTLAEINKDDRMKVGLSIKNLMQY